MDIVTIEITNQGAYSLLNELEKLHLIRVLKSDSGTPKNLSEKFAGKLLISEGDKLQEHIKKSREEWDS